MIYDLRFTIYDYQFLSKTVRSSRAFVRSAYPVHEA